jgi:aminoglycoside phosphotransferase family enzyme/predicted kinase
MPNSIREHQEEVFNFLQNPATHGIKEQVNRIDTHGAAVFLAGSDVYKVKRAVRFPFMDFSTLEKRRAACEAEIAVNRKNAPNLYIGVISITRDGGNLRLGGKDEIVEWAVHMHRFDETATFDHLANRGALGVAITDKLARAIAVSHQRAPRKDGETGTRVLHRLLRETTDELAQYPDPFPPKQRSSYATLLEQAFAKAEPLLLRRGACGQVRHCHGDLHLGNIVLIDGEPILFDAIEFDEAIATSDVLYDLAFILMDLCRRGYQADANHLLNSYLRASEEEAAQLEGLAALPLFMSLRAAIRAKVIAARTEHREEALAYFKAAIEFLSPGPPCLIAIGGLSGTGKSTLAAALAPLVGRAPGALHFRSDIERKRLFSVDDRTRLPEQAYRPDVTQQVYGKLHYLADIALRAGQAAIVDATYQKLEERRAIEAVGESAGHLAFLGIWLEAPLETMINRVAHRKGDASDATAAVVLAQAKESPGAVTWRRIDASRDVQAITTDVLTMLETHAGISGE